MHTVCSGVKFFLQKSSANFVILLPEVLTTFWLDFRELNDFAI
jgi:hypothetical protein